MDGMPKESAGFLVYRETEGSLEVLLVHPGGPFWAKKDEGAWSIPKGEIEGDEEALSVARRELKEETGAEVSGELIALEPVHQPGGKTVYAWAVKGDFDPTQLKSNTFRLEWPPKSGKEREFSEVDRAGWFSCEIAMKKILKGQQGLITQLMAKAG
jgi:predicted NUDIX family NTP pyrophosphohydrolase